MLHPGPKIWTIQLKSQGLCWSKIPEDLGDPENVQQINISLHKSTFSLFQGLNINDVTPGPHWLCLCLQSHTWSASTRQILPLFSSVSNPSTIFFCLQGQNMNVAFWYPDTLSKRNCRLVYLHCKARWHHVFWPLELCRVNAYTRFKQQRGLAVWSVNKTNTHYLAHGQPPLTTHQFALEWDQSTANQWHTIYRKHCCQNW